MYGALDSVHLWGVRQKKKLRGNLPKRESCSPVHSLQTIGHEIQILMWSFSPTIKHTLPFSSLRPSCPELFFPQANTAPERDKAKLWKPPAVTWANGIPSKDFTRCGLDWEVNPCPRPSWPWLFWPHVNNCPSGTQKLKSLNKMRQDYILLNKNFIW